MQPQHGMPVRVTRKHVIPVVSLELRLVSELVRNRADRYTPLIEHMRSHGADRELVDKAMRDRSVDQWLQRTILDRFRRQ